MKKIFLVMLGWMLLIPAPVYAYDDGDFQVWNTDSQEMKVADKLKVVLEEEFHWGDNAREFYYQHYDLGFYYNLTKSWNVASGYRHILSKSNGDFKVENAPYLSATWSGELAGVKVEDRNRFEYEHFDYKSDLGRYRNRLTLRMPWKWTKIELQPYISDEFYLQFVSKDQFSQNRVCSGFSMNFTKNIKAEIYYLLQSSQSAGQWKDTNVLGTKVKLAF